MIRRHLPGYLVVFLLIAPAWSMMHAEAQGGNINTFSNGSAEVTITVSGGQHSTIGFELERNTTINTASFFIKPGSAGDSPGVLELDANQDGTPEWSFNNTGYGHFGQQTVFASGNATESLGINPNQGAVVTPDSPPFLLPSGATISSGALDVGFSPTLTGGFFQTGYIHAVAKGDLNNDSNVDFVLLSRTAAINGSNATTPPTIATAFKVASYDSVAGLTMTSWQTTCTNATRVMTADLNGDNHDDVVAYAPADDQLCIHFTNRTSGGFEPQVNVTHHSSIIDLDFDDFTGNGLDEMVSIRSGGQLHVDQFSNRTNAFTNRDSVTVYVPGSVNTITLTHMYLARFDGTLNNPSVLAAQSSGEAYQMWWRTSDNDIGVSASTVSGVSQGAVIGDFDGDQDLDLVAPTSTGHTSIERDGIWWDTDSHNQLLMLTNASILDYDLDSAAHLLVPDRGTSDGNSSTLTGNLTTYGFWSWGNIQNRVSSQATEVFEPWTAPRAVHHGDMDGDGSIEQLILVGEGSQHGIFISAYHKVGYDIDRDGAVDVEAGGYAGNGSNGLSPLTIEDTTGELTSTLNLITPGLSYTSDGYGVQMASVNLSMHSITEGTFQFSNLDLYYTADFLVNANPSITGNLSNVLNQQMTAGTGSFVVPFNFSTTLNGSFVVYSPSVGYIDGAPDIALPPDPVLVLVDNEPDRVVFEWQPITEFGDDLLEFVVYREAPGQSVNVQNPYDTSVANQTIDMAVQPGQTWTYWVQSVHDFGVTSNISSPLTVTVPYPAPKSFVPNLTATDVPDDEGGALSVSWSPGDPSIVEHRIFVLATDFTDVAELTTGLEATANATSLYVAEDSAGAPLVDGTGYYVAAIGLDVYGNASSNVTTFGPVYPRNDSALPTTLDVNYTDFTGNEHEVLILARTKGLSAVAHLHQDGAPIANATLVFTVEDDQDSYLVDAMTNETGHASVDLALLSDLGPIEALGDISLTFRYDGKYDDPLAQPLDATNATQAAYGTVLVDLERTDPLPLDGDMMFDISLSVATEDVLQSAYLANMAVNWTVLDADGTEISNGSAQAGGNALPISGQGAHDGVLVLQLSSDPPTYYVPGFTAVYEFESEPVVDVNETNTSDGVDEPDEPTFPDTTLPPTLDCGTATYSWVDNGTDTSIDCTVNNPNAFEVELTFEWSVVPNTPPPISFTYDRGTTTIVEAEGSTTVSFTPVRNAPSDGLFPGTQGVGYVFTLTCTGDVQCGTMDASTASTVGELQWTLGEMPVQDIEPAPVADDASSAMTPVLVSIGLVIAVLAGIGGVLYLRGRGDLEFNDDDDEEEDYYEQAMAAPENTGRPKSVDLAASKSLEELKDSGKSLHSDAPEGLATSPSLSTSAEAFVSESIAEGAVAEEESWDEEASEDDGITVDENGTEWWADEDGTWWYREDGWEDWAVWEE